MKQLVNKANRGVVEVSDELATELIQNGMWEEDNQQPSTARKKPKAAKKSRVPGPSGGVEVVVGTPASDAEG